VSEDLQKTFKDLETKISNHRLENRTGFNISNTMGTPFIMLSSASKGLSRGFARTLLRNTTLPMVVGSRQDNLDSVKDKLLKDLNDKSIDPKRLNVVKLDITGTNL